MLRDRANEMTPAGRAEDGADGLDTVDAAVERDLHDRGALHAELRRMAEEVGGYLRRDGLSARTVTAKLRYGDF